MTERADAFERDFGVPHPSRRPTMTAERLDMIDAVLDEARRHVRMAKSPKAWKEGAEAAIAFLDVALKQDLVMALPVPALDPDPMLGMRLAKCPHCGEELSIWPAKYGCQRRGQSLDCDPRCGPTCALREGETR